jgi:hypothetical protein
MTNASGRPLPVHLQEPHPRWVRDLAFVCWLEADRNAARAQRLMEDQWPEDDEDGRIPPTARLPPGRNGSTGRRRPTN